MKNDIVVKKCAFKILKINFFMLKYLLASKKIIICIVKIGF